uniref:Protein MIZU-KUSSEI 1 n=1 Tax=Kalanchoe fedtschenkoi TaxID=63787 RepID=A0A7N0VAS5_KALFE
MKQQHHHHQLSRSSSANKQMILLPPSYIRSNSYNTTASAATTPTHLSPDAPQLLSLPNFTYHQSPTNTTTQQYSSSSTTALALISRKPTGLVASLIRSLLSIPSLVIPATCRWFTANIISPAVTTPLLLGHIRVSTGTLFGYRKGRVCFAIQDHPRSPPLLILDLPISTSALVKEMSSGVVRIALECRKAAGKKKVLLGETEWTMYCNGRKCGTARSTTERTGGFGSWVLDTVGSISVGAGVIPDDKNKCGGEVMYMRARFERVVGNRDSQALYMLNPDGNNVVGGPELSIFFLRL